MPDLENEEEKNLDTQDDVVETLTGEDEDTQEAEEDSEDDAKGEDGESEDDDDSEEDEPEDEDKPEFKKRFTQFKGDNAEEYIPNLEDAYLKSSTEGQRLKQENRDQQKRLDKIASVVANNPELAKAIEDATDGDSPVVDPALLSARADMNERMTTEYNDFVELHPELESDPVLQEEVLEVLSDFSDKARKAGKVLSMKDGLRKSWIYLGHDLNVKETVVDKVKSAASRSKPSGAPKKKSSDTGDLTSEQIAMGKKFGLTKEQLLAARKQPH